MSQLENEQLDICLKVLGIAASRLDAVTKSGIDADESEIRSVTTDYYLLRIQLVSAFMYGRFKSFLTVNFSPGFKEDPTLQSICSPGFQSLERKWMRRMFWKRVIG